MTPEREREILVVFEALGPERIKMAVENAYPYRSQSQRDRVGRCFIGCATTNAERLLKFPRYGELKEKFRPWAGPLESEYEFGDHEQLRTLALQWLAGVKSPPKERRFARVGMALMLLLLVLL